MDTIVDDEATRGCRWIAVEYPAGADRVLHHWTPVPLQTTAPSWPERPPKPHDREAPRRTGWRCVWSVCPANTPCFWVAALDARCRCYLFISKVGRPTDRLNRRLARVWSARLAPGDPARPPPVRGTVRYASHSRPTDVGPPRRARHRTAGTHSAIDAIANIALTHVTNISVGWQSAAYCLQLHCIIENWRQLCDSVGFFTQWSDECARPLCVTATTIFFTVALKIIYSFIY